MTLAAVSGISTYDAEYVAPADMLKIKLVTLDGQILKAFQGIAVSLENF